LDAHREPSLVNEARFGVNYVFINNGAAENGLTGYAQTLGIPDVPSSFLPTMSIGGGSTVGSLGNNDVVQLFADTVIHYEDTLIYTKGNHTMHFGFQGFRYRVDTFYSGNNGEAGTFIFGGFYTTSTPGSSSGGSFGGAGGPISCSVCRRKSRAASTAAPGVSAPIRWLRFTRTIGASLRT